MLSHHDEVNKERRVTEEGETWRVGEWESGRDMS
jgi:hypothetical protein